MGPTLQRYVSDSEGQVAGDIGRRPATLSQMITAVMMTASLRHERRCCKQICCDPYTCMLCDQHVPAAFASTADAAPACRCMNTPTRTHDRNGTGVESCMQARPESDDLSSHLSISLSPSVPHSLTHSLIPSLTYRLTMLVCRAPGRSKTADAAAAHQQRAICSSNEGAGTCSNVFGKRRPSVTQWASFTVNRQQ